MTGHELRRKYLEFFESKNSLIVPSSSLVPTDPTTLLTSAGMQPMVPYFKGEEEPPSRRLASCQKCCRADDLDEVGVTWRHASFFEMMGNFSFGDYFKREAINWAWEFYTRELNIDPKLLWVSVYYEDTEAPEIWKNDIGLSDERILRMGKKDNWWGPVGATGPCGPDSEIFLDRGPKYNTGDPEMDRPGGDGDRYGELWNLVFQQYNQQENGELLPLPAPGIDTGMGLERSAAVLQGVDTIHHTDLFSPIIRAIDNLRRGDIGEFSILPLPLDTEDPSTKPLKVVADHLRAAVFMGADGIAPGNTGRDYMMRRLIRRAFLNGRALGYDAPFLHRIVPVVAQAFGDVYPEVRQRENTVVELIRREEERFGATIEGGMSRLDDLVETLKSKGEKVLSGAEVFRLYETYGFPRELTAEVAAQSGLEIDNEGYLAAAEKHSKVSGAAVGEYATREFGNLASEFVGYNSLEADSTIVAVSATEVKDGQADMLSVVLDRTPFYAESGGQIGDTGDIVGEGFRGRVLDTQKQGRAWVHAVEVLEGEAREGMAVHATVDTSRRTAIQRAHSSTHLLHAALRQHLGTHVEQRGSLVSPDRLRFDFVHFGPITPDEMARIEDTVNEHILQSDAVEIREMSIDDAKKMGAMALFGEKYGDVVRTVRMGDFSLELCGGTHLQTTSAAGFCRILSESGVGANIRRIEALTGAAALAYDREQNEALRETARELGAQPENATSAAERLRSRVRELEKQLQEAQSKMASSSLDELLAASTNVSGVALVAARAPQGLNANTLRELADKLADKQDGVVALAAEAEGKVLWAVKVGKGAIGRGAHAGNLVRELAKLTGGGGGGRPDFAQAGGKDVSQIDAALAQVEPILATQVK
jgi:alanyl-tRNA synthetase